VGAGVQKGGGVEWRGGWWDKIGKCERGNDLVGSVDLGVRQSHGRKRCFGVGPGGGNWGARA